MVYCVCSLEAPQSGISNENTKNTFILKKMEKISLKCLLIWHYDHSLARTSRLEHIFMVSKLFEPLKFYCTCTFEFANSVDPDEVAPYEYCSVMYRRLTQVKINIPKP